MTEGYSEQDLAGVAQGLFTSQSPELAPSVCSDDVSTTQGLNEYGDILNLSRYNCL